MVPAFTPDVQAADVATLVDLVSGGRLKLGLGAGYSTPEFESFGADVRDRRRILQDNAAELYGVRLPVPR